MRGQAKTHNKAATHTTPMPVVPAFQTRPFTAQSTRDEASSFEGDRSSLFGTYLQRRAAGAAAGFGGAPSQMLIQPKLTVGAVGDQYEREADEVAKQVVGRVNGGAAQGVTQEAGNQVQRTPAIQSVPMGHGMRVGSGVESGINRARGGGQLLPDHIRAPMEQAFGADFSGVRVHTGGESDRLNRSLQARAFTTGQDIFFRQAAYNPNSQGGQALLAHELTHVVQQNGTAVQQEPTEKVKQKRPTQVERLGYAAAPQPKTIQRYLYLGEGSTTRIKSYEEIPEEWRNEIDNHEEKDFIKETIEWQIATSLLPIIFIYKQESIELVVEEMYAQSKKIKIDPKDKIYGMKQEREQHTKAKVNKKVRHPTIDSIHNKLNVDSGQVNTEVRDDDEVVEYGEWLNKSRFKPNVEEQESHKNIRKACKAAIVYYTTKGHKIHFELSNLDMAQIVTKTDLNKSRIRSITGSELRFVYREYLKQAQRQTSEANVENIKFYLRGSEVKPPWESERSLWDKYQPRFQRS